MVCLLVPPRTICRFERKKLRWQYLKICFPFLHSYLYSAHTASETFSFRSYQLQQRCCDQGQKIRKGQDTAHLLAPSFLPALVSRFITTVSPYGSQEASFRIPYLASHFPTRLYFLFFCFFLFRSKINFSLFFTKVSLRIVFASTSFQFRCPFLESG